MKQSDELQYDHAVLRGKLDLLEEELCSLGAIPDAMQHRVDAIASCLREHRHREEQSVRAFMAEEAAISEAFFQRLCEEHTYFQVGLALLHNYLAHPEVFPEEQVQWRAEKLVQDIRRHLTHEEAVLFPLLDEAAEGHRALLVR